ncbi:MAG: PqqD family peptide modification chaperone [Sciscionella sp.]
MDDGGLVLLSERSGKLFRCNATAAAMWAALRQYDGQLDAAAGSIAEQYRANAVRVRADLDLLVERLQRAGLVKADS